MGQDVKYVYLFIFGGIVALYGRINKVYMGYLWRQERAKRYRNFE